MSIWPKETTNLTQYLIINDLRPFSRTPVTFEIIDIVMCYLTQAEVKKFQIDLGQLRKNTSNWFATLRFNFSNVLRDYTRITKIVRNIIKIWALCRLWNLHSILTLGPLICGENGWRLGIKWRVQGIVNGRSIAVASESGSAKSWHRTPLHGVLIRHIHIATHL